MPEITAIVEALSGAVLQHVREKGPAAGTRCRVRLLLGRDAPAGPGRELALDVRRKLRKTGPPLQYFVTAERVDAEASKADVHLGVERTRVGDRDRELLALIGTARCLSTDQIRELVFADRHATVAGRRLRQLSRANGRGYVRADHFDRSDRERVMVWALTPAGYGEAATMLPGERAQPLEYVRPQFLDHLAWLNDLFVALCIAGGRPMRVQDRAFRWLCDADRALTFRPRLGEPKPRAVAPDAIIELPVAARRIFVEAERGTHTIVPVSPNKHGATLRKLERYTEFFSEFTSTAANATPYTEHFPDAMTPELLFLVPTESRRNSIRDAIDPVLTRFPRAPFTVAVCTLAEATARYAPFVRRHESPRAAEAKPITLGPGEQHAMRSAFSALVRIARAAKAAGVPPLSEADLVALKKTRELLRRDGDDTPDDQVRGGRTG
jgi:hypothetical protein